MDKYLLMIAMITRDIILIENVSSNGEMISHYSNVTINEIKLFSEWDVNKYVVNSILA